MFDKLEGILERYEEILQQLNDPNIVNDQANYRKLMKEQSDLEPIVEAYSAYKAANQTIEDSRMILDEESDEEMRELAKEEMNEAKEQIAQLEEQLKILLLPKGNPCRSRRRRGGIVCCRTLPDVLHVCGDDALENRTGRYQ